MEESTGIDQSNSPNSEYSMNVWAINVNQQQPPPNYNQLTANFDSDPLPPYSRLNMNADESKHQDEQLRINNIEF